jgi:beta-mannosidase
VFLNGELVATHDNMFLPLEVDVTSLLRASNELVVEFSSGVRVAESRLAAYLAAEGIDPSVTTFYERSFLRKAQYMFGWDWGPRLVSCGIWKPVKLLEYDSRVTDVWVRPKLVDGEWLVDVSWEGEQVSTPKMFANETAQEVVSITESSARIVVRKPALWWPRDFHTRDGRKANTYSGRIEFEGETKYFDYGLRKVELVREPDKWGASFEFVVNGERVFCKGANWIPDHSFPSLVSTDRYGSQVQAMRDLNFNMVRVWGGGLYENDRFYDWCDRYGIMVWQDFPFACAYYPEDGTFLASVEAEATANVRRLRNHPSLVLWCGNNENQQMHEQRWGGSASPKRFYAEKIYDEVLPRLLQEEDPDRPYVNGSPSGKVEGRDSNMDGVGDSHYWEVWHGKGDWKHYEESTSRFSSEFGFASSPSLHAWSKCLDRSSDWKFDSEAVKWHDKTLKGYEKYISFIEMHYPKVETLEDLVYYSQLNQRDALRCGIEHYLMSEFCAGTLVWQFNDCWPAQSWAVQDSEGRMKPASWELHRLYARKCMTMKVVGDQVHVFTVQTVPGNFDLSEQRYLSILNTQTAEEIVREPIPVTSSGTVGCELVLDINLKGIDLTRHVVYAPMAGRWRSSYQSRLLCEPKDVVLTACPIVISTYDEDTHHLLATHPIVDLMVWDPDDAANLSEAHFDPMIYPDSPEPFLPTFRREPKRLVARSLAGYHEVEVTRSPL